jgi:hypothetical protein
VPTALDFAIAISFELAQNDYEFSYEPTVEQIRHFAVDVRREWLIGIINSSALRERFKSVRDSHAAKLIGTDASCLPTEDQVLGDRKAVAMKYFEGFTTSDSTETVKVWMPDNDGVIHFDGELSLTVTVKLNTSQGADQGFFRVGFDYSIERSGDRLHVCFFDPKTKMEAGHFGVYSVGRATNHVLWAR